MEQGKTASPNNESLNSDSQTETNAPVEAKQEKIMIDPNEYEEFKKWQERKNRKDNKKHDSDSYSTSSSSSYSSEDHHCHHPHHGHPHPFNPPFFPWGQHPCHPPHFGQDFGPEFQHPWMQGPPHRHHHSHHKHHDHPPFQQPPFCPPPPQDNEGQDPSQTPQFWPPYHCQQECPAPIFKCPHPRKDFDQPSPFLKHHHGRQGRYGHCHPPMSPEFCQQHQCGCDNKQPFEHPPSHGKHGQHKDHCPPPTFDEGCCRKHDPKHFHHHDFRGHSSGDFQPSPKDLPGFSPGYGCFHHPQHPGFECHPHPRYRYEHQYPQEYSSYSSDSSYTNYDDENGPEGNLQAYEAPSNASLNDKQNSEN